VLGEIFNIHSSSTSLVADSLADIMKLQPLERIVLNGFYNDMNENVKKIVNAFEFRSETLKEVMFNELDFKNVGSSFISKLERLERLEFVGCTRFLQHYDKKDLRLKELKLLYNDNDFHNHITGYHFIGFGTKSYSMAAMINSICGEALIKLALNIVTPETIKAVKESCPNIGFLHIEIYSDQPLDKIIPPICEISSLKTLYIETKSEFEEDGSLIRILGDYLMSVEYLYFNFCYYNLLSFKYFTNNCKANLKKWVIEFPKYLSKDHLSCVNDYQKVHNSLRVLGIRGWEKRGTEIIDLLKDQGVDVVKYKYIFNFYKFE
jgi:hypothetical protein